MNSISSRLYDFFVNRGFCDDDVDTIRRFDKNDIHYSSVINEFFDPLVQNGEILFWNYNEEDIYADICGSFASIAFAWVTVDNPISINIITLVVEG